MRLLYLVVGTTLTMMLVAACGAAENAGGDAPSPTATAPTTEAASTDVVHTTEEIHFVQLTPPDGPQPIMTALIAGRLEVRSRCMAVDGHTLVWPHDVRLDRDEEPPVIRDSDGEIVATVGGSATFGGGEIGSDRAFLETQLTEPLPEECGGPYWIIGDFVYPATPTPVASSAGDIELPHHTGPILSEEPVELVAGVVSADGACLRFTRSDGGEPLLAIWPQGLSLGGADNQLFLDVTGAVYGALDEPHVIAGVAAETLDAVELVDAPTCPGPYLLVSRIGDDDPLVRDAAWYAVDFGVSLTEARWRLGATDGVGLLGPLLEEQEPDTFAGLYIQHEPSYRVVVLFTENGEETLREYTEGKSFEVEFEAHQARYTLAELKDAQWEVIQFNQQANIRASSATMVMDNRVQVYVTDTAAYRAKLNAAGFELPPQVQVVEVNELDSDD